MLSGRAGAAGIQWLLFAPESRRALRRELATLLDDRCALGPCRLRRAKFKPGRKLTAYYDVHLRDSRGMPAGSRPVAVIWTPGGASGREGSAADGARVHAEALRRGLVAPFRSLEAEPQRPGPRILVSPLDESFPQLVRLSDPSYVAEILEARGVGCVVWPIRYRPGQRHVLRYEPCASQGAGKARTTFAKLYRGERGRLDFGIATAVAEWLESRRSGLGAVRPLTYVVSDRALLYPRVAGVPLSEHLRRGRGDAAQELLRAGSMLRALHLFPLTHIDGLEHHELASEQQAILRASEHLEVLLPSAAARIRGIVDLADDAHAHLPQESPTFVHGDFKADHLWATSRGLTLIDIDSCRLGDPAIDLGKLLADLWWWYALSGRPGAERAQRTFLDGYLQEAQPPGRIARARLYEALLLAKIAVRRVPLYDPEWEPWTEALIARAERLGAEIRREPHGSGRRRAVVPAL